MTTEEGCKLTRFDVTAENRERYILWHANPERQEPSRENEITSRLPLELDIIIEGYGLCSGYVCFLAILTCR